MKRLIAALLCLCLMLCGCTAQPEKPHDETKLQIVCTSFPAYDFAREIAGDRAELTLLIKPGSEVHSYEPTPKDMIRIQESDLFICNGGESEQWAKTLITPELNTIYMMGCVDTVEESADGIYNAEDGEPELDEHVWTSPLNAIKISEEICNALCKLDTDNAEAYKTNFTAYKAQLMALDREFRQVIKNSGKHTLVFADRFPMRYFALEYGLDCYAAFPGCSSETEPSAKTVAYLIDRVREDKIPAVLYMEFSNQKMADVICEDTGCKKLPFYSAHSVSAEQFEQGVSYLDLMRINLNSLKEALG
ncbi:MAG: metal ABC transporter substrate-binding protein [Oscillospiraceae bacterium]|nr:metal ABC transporter substrate-binding protein [Oscillospiraceae bacterium]